MLSLLRKDTNFEELASYLKAVDGVEKWIRSQWNVFYVREKYCLSFVRDYRKNVGEMICVSRYCPNFFSIRCKVGFAFYSYIHRENPIASSKFLLLFLFGLYEKWSLKKNISYIILFNISSFQFIISSILFECHYAVSNWAIFLWHVEKLEEFSANDVNRIVFVV